MNTKIGLAAMLCMIGGLAVYRLEETQLRARVCFVTVLSVLAYAVCVKLIPIVKELCLKRGLCGRDINKNGTTPIPEALGIVPATLYLVVTVMFQPFFEHTSMGQYNAALTSTCFMVFLGFVDDVFDLRWSVKITSSFLATLPLLVAYTGSTYIAIPSPLVPFFGGLAAVDLGILYHVYMCFMGVFCTNSINIFAGVNGLEAGQSFVIAVAVLIHNIIELGGIEHEAHMLSFCLILPFSACTLGLLYYNWYPSQVFVGDTFTYFAGMTLAVSGILGHFTKTLMLFFLPQIINFVLSVPQLFNTRWLPCPRHRLPRYDPATGLLHAIPTNWTLINLFLFIFGPMPESRVTKCLLIFQTLCCLFAFFVRYYVASFFYV